MNMEQKQFYHLANFLSTIASAGIVGANEICQELVTEEIIKYQTPYGHVMDIFAVPLISGTINTYQNSPYSPLIIATIYSGMEIAGLSGKCDQ